MAKQKIKRFSWLKVFAFSIPFVVVAVLFAFLWRGLSLQPNYLPSAVVNQPVPTFALTELNNANQIISEHALKGKVSLLNVWASWCSACSIEHPVLIELAKSGEVPIYGLNYKDSRINAINWLQEKGNPYQLTIYDGAGQLGLDFGVYGAPETFVIDTMGVIRHKYVGPLTMTVWQTELAPVVKRLAQHEG